MSLLRKVTRADVTEDNADLGVKMIKTKSVSRGIRVYATNPWTHRTAAYTLKASGKKVTHRPEVTEKVLSGMGDRVIGPRGQRIAHAAGVARVGNCGEGVATDRGVYHR
ncbi:hypothetical protein [Actinoplanes regularis]|uniref:hypothetical protein n=1 Tax=Actinoplanes regularis TaxID=52697 RepID=UPI00117877C0|nr:hypothetical protein [Actinoplanes regularis]